MLFHNNNWSEDIKIKLKTYFCFRKVYKKEKKIEMKIL